MNKSRYNLDLSDSVYTQLKDVAQQHSTSVSEIVRRYITLGLLASRPNTQVIIRENERDRELVLL